MEQQRLYVPSIEAVAITAHWGAYQGWALHLAWRRDGSTWADEPGAVYECLTAAEAVQTVDGELERLLLRHEAWSGPHPR